MAEGGGGGFPGSNLDHCICMCIRKFMEMLRTSQNICHDTGCLDEYPSLQRTSPDNGVTQVFLLLLIWVIIAALLFAYRPSSLRSARTGNNGKPSQRDHDNPPGGPTPPDVGT